MGWSPNGNARATFTAGAPVQIWDLGTGKQKAIYSGHTGKKSLAAAWSQDGSRMASGGYPDETIRIWDSASGEETATIAFSAPLPIVLSLAWRPDGKVLAAGIESSIRLLDTTTNQQSAELQGHKRTIGHLAWRRDGKVLASASGDGSVRVWPIP